MNATNARDISYCTRYVNSLINNLSLLSKYVLRPTSEELQALCKDISDIGMPLDDTTMQMLIYGPVTTKLADNPSYKRMVKRLQNIHILTIEEDNSQYGGMY